MACCRCCCGDDCPPDSLVPGKCCCGSSCCAVGKYCCSGNCQDTPCVACASCDGCEIVWTTDEGAELSNEGNQYYRKILADVWSCDGPVIVPYSSTYELWANEARNGGNRIPRANIPAFSWKAGYPDKLNGCRLYWSLKFVVQALRAPNCLSYDFFGGVCFFSSRRALCSEDRFYSWKLLKMTCGGGSASLSDITNEAITQIDPFSGVLELLKFPCNRDCVPEDKSPKYPFFDDAPVACS